MHGLQSLLVTHVQITAFTLTHALNDKGPLQERTLSHTASHGLPWDPISSHMPPICCLVVTLQAYGMPWSRKTHSQAPPIGYYCFLAQAHAPPMGCHGDGNCAAMHFPWNMSASHCHPRTSHNVPWIWDLRSYTPPMGDERIPVPPTHLPWDAMEMGTAQLCTSHGIRAPATATLAPPMMCHGHGTYAGRQLPWDPSASPCHPHISHGMP